MGASTGDANTEFMSYLAAHFMMEVGRDEGVHVLTAYLKNHSGQKNPRIFCSSMIPRSLLVHKIAWWN